MLIEWLWELSWEWGFCVRWFGLVYILGKVIDWICRRDQSRYYSKSSPFDLFQLPLLRISVDIPVNLRISIALALLLT